MSAPTEPDQLPADDSSYSRPPKRVSGDWSAHIATTLERLADLLTGLSPEEWEVQSLCDEWRVRDVVGHMIWRLGERNPAMLASGFKAMGRARFNPAAVISTIAVANAQAEPEELILTLRRIAGEKLLGQGRTGIIELTEAIVHTYDITEALGLDIRLSPRSTGAVALAHVRSVTSGKSAQISRERSLRATDARWLIGTGEPLNATAAEIITHLFSRKRLV